jgi:hypothetical protein
MVSLGFGTSKSSNVASGANAGYDLQENISQSGSQQGSQADSYGLNVSQSGQNIYGPQAGYLNDIYGQAQNLYRNNQLPNYQVAGMNPMMGANAGFATGGGNDIYTQQLMNSLNNTGGYGAAANTANRMSSGNAYGAPMTDGLNMATLGASVNNPYLDGQIDAASRDVTRNLNENQLTGNAAMAAGTGNSGSSRRGVMDAIAMRGAADRVADIGSTMRGAAYTQGLDLSNRTALANQNAMMGTNAMNANLMSQGANLNYNIGQAGSAGLRDAYNTGASNAGMVTDTGAQMRQYQQQLLDAQFKNEMNPYNSLEMYKNFIGAPTVLSNSNSLGLQGSTSNSFGNSFNDSYSYGMGANMGSNSATGKSSSFNANVSVGGRP